MFEVDILVQDVSRPKVDEVHLRIGAFEPVDATKALDNANRVPVDVVIDDSVTVLQILAFGDAVGGDENVDFLVSRHSWHFVTLFGLWRKVSENVVEVR